MNDFLVLFLCAISGFSTMLGIVFAYIPVLKKEKIISFGFSLSFIVMFLISITELIPVGFSLVKEYYNFVGGILYCLFFLLFGAFLIYKINQYIPEENELYKIGILSMITILIHNIPEGIICAITGVNNAKLGLKMIFLIMLHNIPEGIAITIPIYYATHNRKKALVYTFVSGAGEVIGALFTLLILKYWITNSILSIIYIITAGIMIYLSIRKLLFEALKSKCYLSVLAGIVIGFVILVLTL